MKQTRYWCLLVGALSCSLQIMISHPALGKTHFIVGESTRTLPVKAEINTPLCPEIKNRTSSGVQVLFTPYDDIRGCLLQLINKEQKAIYVAVFMITDPAVANALGEARKRGVSVELVTDVGCLKDGASKVSLLCNSDCAVYVYNPTLSLKKVSLMHHKFALFSSSENIWTGSYNFTKAANNSNQENVIIFSDKIAL